MQVRGAGVTQRVTDVGNDLQTHVSMTCTLNTQSSGPLELAMHQLGRCVCTCTA
jgi:hypothetical protein